MKIMIADDEKWVRATIKSLIPFEKLGMTLVCEAANGIEALELCRQNSPDILLTDIKMPGLTGLDLIKELRGMAPGIKIAIISGYSDFEYAKTAMKYGISDYLLKPVDENELLQVLARFKKELEEETRLNESKLKEKERYRMALPMMSEAFLNRMVSQGSLTAENIRSELARYGICFTRQYYTVMVLSPDDPEELDTREKTDYWKSIVKRVMKRCMGAVSFPLQENSICLMSVINHDGEAPSLINEAFSLCSRIALKRLGITLSAGISSSVRQLGMLPQLAVQARRSLESRFWEGPGRIYRYSQGMLSRDVSLQLTEEILNKIILNIKLSNVQTAFSYIDSTGSSLERQTDLNPESVKEFYWQLVQSVLSMLNIQLPFIRHETLTTGEQPYERLKDAVFASRLQDCTKDMLQRIFDYYHDKNPVNNTNLVDNAKKVIEGNFAGDISLDQVARHVHLSPAYLSELFKKETGMSFIDYKTIVRIENAKRLLENSPLNIYDISTKVGYSDPKYFSKLFKKITGKTVYEYRKGTRN